MVFNWFRRQYDEENPQAEQEAPSGETPMGETPVEAKVESHEPEPTAQSQELLNWAKSAYANIQKQQIPVATADVTTSIEEPLTDNRAPARTETPTPETITEVVAQEPETAEDLVPETLPLTSTEPEVSGVVPESIAEVPPPETSEALPFWAQSASDRQARIDALAASAIAEPEVPAPEIPPPTKSIETFKPIVASSTPVEIESAIAFDEG
ncbi:MAG: signal recognition particle-docking protein FtsY, partial [Pseudanabaena sp. RU_4_16]|nr:signal recognition particle-docking protein FtsY [Pseudanabaena sp. RU_4_16]